MDMNDLEKWIDRKKPDVERRMLRTRGDAPRIRTRERDPDEQRILDKLCIKRWKQAEQEGKIKYISITEWFYELDWESETSRLLFRITYKGREVL